MKSLESELVDLFDLYRELNEMLAGFDETGPGRGSTALIGRVLQSRQLVLRMAQMDARIGELATEWEELQQGLEPLTRKSIQRKADDLCKQASNLRQLVEQHAHQIEGRRADLRSRLAEIQKGERFLESVKPIKANYPKFIDSLG